MLNNQYGIQRVCPRLKFKAWIPSEYHALHLDPSPSVAAEMEEEEEEEAKANEDSLADEASDDGED